MAIQLSTAQTNLGLVLKDISDVPAATFLYWIQNISNYVYRELCKVDPERFISTQSYSITNGTNSYALPSDFQNVQSVGTGLYLIDANGDDTDKRWTLTEFGSNRPGYYLDSSNIVITPDPNAQTDSAKLRYIPNAPTYTATTEYLTMDKLVGGTEIIPDEYIEYVTKALEVQYFQWDADPSSESLADMRYTRILDDLLGNIRRTPGAYIMPDISLLY